jgi:GNAT superfamily N-acetyltransferase
MSEVQYRLASINDIKILIDSRVDFLVEFGGKRETEIENNLRARLKEYFENALGEHTYVSWIAMVNDEFAGIGGMVIYDKPGNYMVPEGRTGYIMNMYTVPKFRKQGIANTIINKLLETGKEMGIRFYELHASKEGEPLYRRNEFQLHHQPTFRKIL